MVESTVFQHLETTLQEFLMPLGFEVWPFKVGWYNAVLHSTFYLPYPEDTLAFIVLSAPQMFEKAFKPFLQKKLFKNVKDPIDECVSHYFTVLKQNLKDLNVDIIYDHELQPNRKPKVLVQTAAHVAGAAYYYQRKDVKNDPWGEKKIYGVCIHPRYGGWFAMRGVLIFPDILVPSLQQKDPVDCLSSDNKIIQVLENFNFHWQDWTYRDIIDVEERYSEEQKKYFSTPPKERLPLLEQMVDLRVPFLLKIMTSK
ncbi:cyanocobalamin reductase / alkylcobalamin dealkylase [Protopterus annectens]|uniref:cyanocobalamin reductase / alkylcobalamin dealkylase n=1 Tax=Protopterus annectens TaxID=7888 RepID=UPI001CF9B2A0|nr:cyanocobalamin reductase / alkylcobalamin dealkylase [Protopterus annectens]